MIFQIATVNVEKALTLGSHECMHKTTTVVSDYTSTVGGQIRYDTLDSVELTGDLFCGGTQRTGVNTDPRFT